MMVIKENHSETSHVQMKEVTVGSLKLDSSYLYIYIYTYVHTYPYLVYIPIYGSCTRSTIIKSRSNLSRFTSEKRAQKLQLLKAFEGHVAVAHRGIQAPLLAA
jgi:hypothetical protein